MQTRFVLFHLDSILGRSTHAPAMCPRYPRIISDFTPVSQGNVLFKGAVIVGHENLPEDMQWLIRRQTEPDWKRKELDHAASILRNLRAALPQAAENRMQTRLIRSDIAFYGLFAQDIEEGYEVVKPSLMFADRHTLDLGDLTLELVFFGKGHSLSDTLVYIPQEKLLVTGAIAYQRANCRRSANSRNCRTCTASSQSWTDFSRKG